MGAVSEPAWSNPAGAYHVADVLDFLRTQPDASVQCVVTSPPYWGLRDYGVDGAIGLEPTVDAYVERMVEVFREVRRVLRDDGTLWLNLGDAYAANWNSRRDEGQGGFKDNGRERTARTPGFKPKDLIGLPWRVAFALQADGWYLRSDIIWHKPNAMPESVTDRPTKAHEYLFLLTKSARYFWDAEAVRAESSPNTHRRAAVGGEVSLAYKMESPGRGNRNNPSFQAAMKDLPIGSGRTTRTVWTIATQPYPEAHFATFPQKLVEPCVLAGTSAKGCCAKCGAPWERVVKVEGETARQKQSERGKSGYAAGQPNGNAQGIDYAGGHGDNLREYHTTGWRATCDHDADVEPCVVMDPFMGSGTVALVAQRLGRRWLGCDLNPEYAEMARHRCEEFTRAMAL